MKPLNILVSTGGGLHSDQALLAAVNLARSLDGTITVLTVVENESERSAGLAIVEQAAALLEETGFSASAKVVVGPRVASIVREADSGQYDMLVIGQRPGHGLLTRILGPLTLQVVEQVHLPVFITNAPFTSLRHLLLCDSGGSQVPLLDRLFAQLPQLVEAAHHMTVLHVMSQISAAPGINGQDLRATAEELMAHHAREGELLEQDLQKLAQMHVQPQPLVRHGLVVDEIVDEAKQGAYDLVIIGAHEQGKWPRFLLDDLAGQIIQQIERSVLVIR